MALLASPDVGIRGRPLLKNDNNASPVADSPWRARTETHVALCDYPLAGCVRPRQSEGLAASAEPDARNAPDLAARPRLRVTRSEIAIHEFGRHRHHDQSKNPAHHTTGSKLVPRRAALKFNLDAIYRSIMQTDGVSPDDISRCSLSSLTASAVLARSLFP